MKTRIYTPPRRVMPRFSALEETYYSRVPSIRRTSSYTSTPCVQHLLHYPPVPFYPDFPHKSQVIFASVGLSAGTIASCLCRPGVEGRHQARPAAPRCAQRPASRPHLSWENRLVSLSLAASLLPCNPLISTTPPRGLTRPLSLVAPTLCSRTLQ